MTIRPAGTALFGVDDAGEPEKILSRTRRCVIGFVAPLVGIAWVVLMVVAASKAANFEDYRYPLIIGLIK